MGAQESKVKISALTQAQCFPWFSNEEDLLSVVRKIDECHFQAIQAATWVGSLLFPAHCVPGGLVYSASTILFTFILYQLTGTSTSSSNDNLQCSAKTLEDALIDAKVTTAIARKSVCELQAKICIIQNRYERLLSKISVDDRRLEVVPAIQTCEEVLQLFHDPTHVFRLHPLISSPFLITFSGIFVSVAELSMVLIPSYKTPLLKEMILLKETLRIYKLACIQARTNSIKFKNLKPDSMMDAVAGNNNLRFQMQDASVPITGKSTLLNLEACSSSSSNGNERQCSGSKTKNIKSTEQSRDVDFVDGELEEENKFDKIYDSANEAIEAYKKILIERYSVFFDSASKTVSQFSAFEKTCQDEAGPSRVSYECGENCTFLNVQKNKDDINANDSSEGEIFHSL